LAAVADCHIVAYASDSYLQPDDLAAKHAQLFVLDLLYLLVAQCNFSRVATMLAASAMAVSDHRRGAARSSASDRRPSRQGRPGAPTTHPPRPSTGATHA
jgi:hypothetical protein